MCLKLTEKKQAYNELVEFRKNVQKAKDSPDFDEALLTPPRKKADQEEDSWLEANKIFDGFILFAIILSSLMLPLDNPLNDPNSEQTKNINLMNEIFTGVFVLELTIKAIAKGVFFNNLNHIDPYLKSSWN